MSWVFLMIQQLDSKHHRQSHHYMLTFQKLHMTNLELNMNLMEKIKMPKPIKKQVESLQFTLLSPDEIKKISKAKIITPELYDVDGYPVDGGLMDLRLGAIDPGVRCRTCGGRLKECL